MDKTLRTQKRQTRTRAKLVGSKEMPRLCVHRSNTAMYAQLIDDSQAKTLIGVSEGELAKGKGTSSTNSRSMTKTEKAKALGFLLAKKASNAKIKKAIFDRGSYQFHGRVKAFAEGAREGGLQF